MTTARRLYFLIVACLVSFTGTAQCLTDFAKLVPEPTPDLTTGFGSSISLYNDLLAVGAPGNDSLGNVAGATYIYQRQVDNTWKKIATTAPSDPQPDLAFGTSVKLSANYLAVGASGLGGRVYIFKKPPGGWVGAVENYILTVTGSVGLASSPIDPIDISDDERTIAIVDQYKSISAAPARSGFVHVFHRQANHEWGDHAPVSIGSPEDRATDFGRAGVHIIDDRIVTGTPISPVPYGTIYVIRDPSGNFSNFVLEARLTVNATQGTNGIFSLGSLAVMDEGIVSAAPTYLNVPGGGGIAFFKKPDGNVWTNSEPSCVYRTNITRIDMLTTDGTDIFARFNSGGGSRFGVIRKGSSQWCNATVEILKNIPGGVGDVLGPYASRITASGGNVVTGMAPLPDNPDASVAIEAFHRNSSSWSSTVLYDSRKTTADHLFGQAVLSNENHVFIGAVHDGTMKANGGAVYIYEKQGTSWTKISKVLPPAVTKFDDNFGSSLSINQTQLAIGAPGYGTHGKIFIYNKNGDSWQSPVPAQQIELPASLNADFYGDHLAMNDDWLVIPYTYMNPFRIKIAIYKKASTQWEYIQSVDIQAGNIIVKQMSAAVDIDGETIVAGGSVVERNTDGFWEITARLTPSDPESVRIAPDFSHFITNGSSFGQSVDIEGDNIFIGAPQQDFGTTWDVGAVYVFAKLPGREWSDMNESVKIVPRVKDENELFGYSLDALENTLIVGAPGADFLKDGTTARNKGGRSYIFQSKDYFWKHVTPIQDFTGDALAADYYGISVSLDGDNFIVGASIDDLVSGKLSGSAYVATSPPIVRLVAPTCANFADLFLFGYPSGGTWSGPGLTDAANGTFSPAVAGVGIHELEYTTASCTGKLLIEVGGPVSLTPVSPTDIVVCKEPAPISVPLAVTSDARSNYQWYYRAPNAEEFDEVDEHAATMTAKNRGEYYVEIFDAGCSLNSPTINIHSEDFEVKIDPPTGCILPSSPINLTADPIGGTWSGDGVSGSTFKAIAPGYYAVTYTYTTAINCTVSDKITINVDPLKAELKPDTDRIDVCFGSETTLSTTAPSGSIVRWNFSPAMDAAPQVVSTSTDYSASKNGYYFAEVSNGHCSVVTNPVHVLMLEQDTIQAPNVFTPNGDGKNDNFSVSLGSEKSELTLFNRYGRPVFENKAGGSWDGGDHPTGIYFWVATVPGCDSETRTVKGFVQLIR